MSRRTKVKWSRTGTPINRKVPRGAGLFGAVGVGSSDKRKPLAQLWHSVVVPQADWGVVSWNSEFRKQDGPVVGTQISQFLRRAYSMSLLLFFRLRLRASASLVRFFSPGLR